MLSQNQIRDALNRTANKYFEEYSTNYKKRLKYQSTNTIQLLNFTSKRYTMCVVCFTYAVQSVIIMVRRITLCLLNP